MSARSSLCTLSGLAAALLFLLPLASAQNTEPTRTPTETAEKSCVQSGAMCAAGQSKKSGKYTASVVPRGPSVTGRALASKANVATTTQCGIAPNPATTNETITFYTYVTAASGTPTGTVKFLNGATTLGTATLSYGAGQFTAPANTLSGNYSVTASYGGATGFAASVSSPVSLSVTGTVNAATTTAVTANPSASTLGSSVTLKTAVTASSGTPTGSVALTVGSTSLGSCTLASGTCSIATTALPLGTDTITASYAGATGFNASSGSTTETVTAALTATTTVLTTTTPSVVIPNNEVLTATVTGGTTPTGTVTFTSGGTTVGTATLNGSGVATLTLSTSGFTAGSYTYTAAYSGDSTHAASTSGTVTIQVTSSALTATSTAIGIAPNPIPAGQSATFYTNVTAASGTPTGTVSFVASGVTLGTATLSYGAGQYTAPANSIAGGTYTVTAVYSGSSTYAASTSQAVSLTVAGSGGTTAPTTTTVTATPANSSSGTSVTLDAVVAESSATPTGTVSFTVGGTSLGSCTLASGTCSVATTALPVGTDTITASYAGATGFSASTGTTTATVSSGSLSATTTSLTTSTPTVVVPADEEFSVTVTGGATPTGTVTFLNGSTVIGTALLNGSGVAMLSNPTTGLTAGTYTYTASYGGDATHSASTSGSVSIQVQASTGATEISVTVNPLGNRHVISPLIYGVNFPPSAAYIQATGSTLARWGGDGSSNYNWTNGYSNNVVDYYWTNFSFTGTGTQLGSLYPSSQGFVTGAIAAGATPLISIAELPWAAKDNTSASFDVSKYGAQCAVDPFNGNYGDGEETDCETNITGNSPSDDYINMQDVPGNNDPTGTVYRSQWISSLATAFGSAPHIYGVDNEPELWGFLHRDVHPAGSTYQEIRNLFVNEAPVIHQYDPAAITIGPDDCCWYFYWNMPNYDDKAAHANIDFVQWWLNEVLWADETSGSRTLDWFDLHAYPDGNSAGYTQAQLRALTLRLPRDFWDPNYINEGPDVNQIYATMMQPNPTIAFRFPRMRAMMNSIYPGTEFSLTEWNLAQDGETDISTALADIDAYGLFGQERLYAASRWPAPASTEPAYWSLVLYRNYDGAGHGFGTTSVQVTNNGDPDVFSSYAALNSTGTQMTLMLMNKDPENTQQITLNLGGFNATSLTTYSLSQNDQTGIVSASLTPTSTITLAPYTATLLVMNGTFGSQPATEWDLNPDATMVPANGTVVVSPKILSGTGSVTLSNPQVIYENPTSGTLSVSLTTPKITTTTNGAITIQGGSTPGFYEYVVTGTDSSGVVQTQDGWVLIQNPSATLTTTGNNQSATRGTAITLVATLVPGESGGSVTGADIFFTTSAGTLSSREVATDANGNATVTLTLPNAAEKVTVTAEGQYGLGHPIATFTETSQ